MRKIKELEGIPSQSSKYSRLYQRLRNHGSIRKTNNIDRPWPMKAYKANFDKLHGEGSLNKLVELLSAPCNTYKDIGKVFGVSRERVRQWRVRFAKEFNWDQTGYQRRNVCTIQHVIQRAIDAPNSSISQVFMDKLEAVGLTGKPVISITNHKRSNTLSVNGYRCKLNLRKTAVRISAAYRYLYYNFYTNGNLGDMDMYNFQLFGCGDNDVYVIPTNLICFHYPKGRIYIPTSLDNYGWNNIFPKIDWRKYKNAWHLLNK